MSADLTPAEALLSVAAATTEAEMHAAMLALIGTGSGVLTDLDTSDLVSGDGTAGQQILAATGRPGHDRLAQRARRLHLRLLADLGYETYIPVSHEQRARSAAILTAAAARFAEDLRRGGAS